MCLEFHQEVQTKCDRFCFLHPRCEYTVLVQPHKWVVIWDKQAFIAFWCNSVVSSKLFKKTRERLQEQMKALSGLKECKHSWQKNITDYITDWNTVTHCVCVCKQSVQISSGLQDRSIDRWRGGERGGWWRQWLTSPPQIFPPKLHQLSTQLWPEIRCKNRQKPAGRLNNVMGGGGWAVE